MSKNTLKNYINQEKTSLLCWIKSVAFRQLFLCSRTKYFRSRDGERDRLENYFSELEKLWICSLGPLVHSGHSDHVTQSPTPGARPTSGGLNSGTVTPPSWRSPALPRSEVCKDRGDRRSGWPGLDRRASRIIRGYGVLCLDMQNHSTLDLSKFTKLPFQ